MKTAQCAVFCLRFLRGWDNRGNIISKAVKYYIMEFTKEKSIFMNEGKRGRKND